MLQDKKDYIRKEAYDILWEKCEHLEKNIKTLEKNVLDERFSPKATSNQVFKLERALSEEKTTTQELFKTVKRLRQQITDMYAEKSHSAPCYHFSEIPNNKFGTWLVKIMKLYLNSDRYSIRVRGQYLDNSKLEKYESWRNYTHGQPLNKSKCFRVYINQKKEEIV